MTAPLRAIHVEDPITPQVRAMLQALGEDPAREGLAQTPARYAKAMRYLAGGYALDVESVLGSGVFAAEGEGAVVVRDIEFHSLCEHHLLPFYGTVRRLPAGAPHRRTLEDRAPGRSLRAPPASPGAPQEQVAA